MKLYCGKKGVFSISSNAQVWFRVKRQIGRAPEMIFMRKIWAIVVTYNRKELLRECVTALLRSRVDQILVVDNASSDQTGSLFEQGAEFFDPRVTYMRLRKNEGGAGGFYWGTRYAFENGA